MKSQCFALFFKVLNILSIGEQVLVIGAGPSGMDLAYEISKKAERVTLSHHHKPNPKTIFPSNVDQKPDVRQLTENGAEFADDSKQMYSVIFYCTGKNNNETNIVPIRKFSLGYPNSTQAVV